MVFFTWRATLPRGAIHHHDFHLLRLADDRLRQFLNDFDIFSGLQHLTMEFTSPQAGDMAVFGELREDLEIGLGCVDVTPGKIDSAETVAGRVRQALRHLAPERITLNTGACGGADPPVGANTNVPLVAT